MKALVKVTRSSIVGSSDIAEITSGSGCKSFKRVLGMARCTSVHHFVSEVQV
jgi:hypothetical protein